MTDTLRHRVVLDLDIPITHEPTGEVRPAQIGESWWDALSCRVRTASTLAQVIILRKLPWPLRLRHVNWKDGTEAYWEFASATAPPVYVRRDGIRAVDSMFGLDEAFCNSSAWRDRTKWCIVTDEERKELHGPWPKMYRGYDGVWRFDGPDDSGTAIGDDGSVLHKAEFLRTWAERMRERPTVWTLLTADEVAKLGTAQQQAERIVKPKADRRAETCEYGVAGCCGWLGSVAEPKPPWIGPVTAGLPDCRNCPCWKPKEPQGSDAL